MTGAPAGLLGVSGENPDRRVVVKLLGAGATGVLLLELALVAGCAETKPDGPLTVSVPLSELPEGKRLTVKLGKTPVELHRDGERIVARSLVCTHQGCTVAWQEDARRYKCPCQEAWFDAQGRPVQGPIDKPLAEFPVTIAGDAALVTKPA